MHEKYAKDGAQFAALRVRCQRVLCERVHACAKMAAGRVSMLTRAVKGVLEHAPEGLKWLPLAGKSCACFEAETQGSDSHVYTINLLTGCVLLDGAPPRSLPKTFFLALQAHQHSHGNGTNK